MILDEARAARKAREEEEQNHGGLNADGNYLDGQPSVLPAPPAYEPRSSATSPGPPSPGPSSPTVFSTAYAIPSSSSDLSASSLASPTSPTQRTPLLRSPLSSPTPTSARWHRVTTVSSVPWELVPNPSGPTRRVVSTKTRFFKALGIAALVYCGLVVVFFIFVESTRPSKMQGPFPWGKPALPREEDGTLYPWTGCDLDSFEQAIGDPLEWTENAQLPFVTLQHPPLDDGEAIIRPNSSDSLHHQNKGRPDGDGRDGRPGGGDRPYGAPFEATSYFTMPSTTLDNLYLLTRGSHAQGKIKYIEAEYTDTPTVSVKMYYWHRDMRSSVNICMLTHNDTSQGVGIFTPDKRWDWMPIGQRRAVFDILVTLPVGNSKRISQLEADVPNFNQLFYHVDSPLDVVRISATQGDITVEGQLRAKIIDIATSNGEIYGQFWTDESIRLETTNAGISANILMINEHTGPTSAFLKTSSGTIVIRWLLSSSANRGSPSWPGHGGNFVIDSTTSNALVYHTFEDTPLEPNVIFDTRTSKNSASVTMWRTVEGPFEMHGDIGVPLVETHLRAVDDPMQLGRDPILKILGFSEDMLEGYFHWRQASPAGDGNSNEGRNVEERTNIDNVLSPSAGVTKTKSRIRIFAENGKPMLNFV